MLNRARHSLHRDRRSVAGLEFALILPLMVALIGGVYDLSQAIIVYAQVSNAAQSMVASASSLAVRTNGQTGLFYDQIQLVESQIWADVPTLANGSKPGNPKAITLSSVFYYPVTSTTCDTTSQTNCTFAADIAWSVAYTGPNNSGFLETLPSNCTINHTSVAQNQYAPTVTLPDRYADFPTANIAGSTATFPGGSVAHGVLQNEAGVAPILAITIEYTYVPLFTVPLSWRGVNNFVLGQFTFYVTGYWPVRSASTVETSIQNGAFKTTSFNPGLPPLTNQFTQIYGTPSGSLVTSTGANAPTGAYCVNTNATYPNETATAPVPTS
jgi:Flp pilus assembly protein TadG